MKTDIAIIGAGIAGLWTYHRLRAAGYSAVLLENEAIGSGQTIASQGIIHSGLKYLTMGKVHELAKSVNAMPARWQNCFDGADDVNLTGTVITSQTQYMFIPKGMMGDLLAIVAKKRLAGDAKTLDEKDWPTPIKQSGFDGTLLYMDEPVVDASSLIERLAAPYREDIYHCDGDYAFNTEGDSLKSITVNGETIEAEKFIVTAASSTIEIAKRLGFDDGVETQARPLVQPMMRGAPYELYCHYVGPSEKPVFTLTTHKLDNGELVWYFGGSVAEYELDENTDTIIANAQKAVKKYLPNVALEGTGWATLPVNRIEGKVAKLGWMPDRPTVHTHGNCIFAWPTKLTFAPLLGDEIMKLMDEAGQTPTHPQEHSQILTAAPFAKTPWQAIEENNQWNYENLAAA